MSEHAPNTAGPFVVRAHHASVLWRMVYGGFSPEMTAADIRGVEQGEYRRDVLGTTAEEAKMVVGGAAAYLRGFNELPDSADVTFTTRQKDGICGSCIIGSHCAVPKPRLDGDAYWIAGLQRTANNLGLDVATSSVTVGPDSEGVSMPTELYTDARTARTLVSERILPLRAAMPGADPEYEALQKIELVDRQRPFANLMADSTLPENDWHIF